ncbi:hypothetical protein I3271_05480 [Photobacterium leiognathi]|uniref:hypothetical protein n=1 Tax=Photobacterium leiognathi TaxID=553611 RepID=UPI001EDFAF2E|nr:hypothetical protein [Photobacterium leiognathi]MCG3884132.1 hypothetical protein [Photobacterium leiognathi]
MRVFLIAGGTYELSASNKFVVITRKFEPRNAIAEVSVSFPVKTPESAENFVKAATEDDIKRGIAKMDTDLLVANLLSKALKNSLVKRPVKPNYSNFINKHLKS